MRRDFFDQQGSALLLTILMVSLLLITSVAIIDLVLSDFRKTSGIAQSSAAFYAGESGLEEAIFRIRKLRETPESLHETVGELENKSAWTLDTDDKKMELNFALPKQNTSQVDIFDAEYLSKYLGAGAVELSWKGGSSSSKIESTVVSWPVATEISWQADPLLGSNILIEKKIFSGGQAVVELLSGMSHRVRIRSLNDDLASVRLAIRSVSGEALPLPNYVVIRSLGSNGKTVQSVTAEFPRFLPQSGVFDFVIFSSEDLIKQEQTE